MGTVATKKNKGGRPRKLFTDEQWKEFENLCALQCTKLEICEWFGIEDDTLEKLLKEHYRGKGFSEVFKLKRVKGRISLRRTQFQMAQTNPAMAIFLGKNYLGQKDKQDVAIEDATIYIGFGEKPSNIDEEDLG